MSRNGGLSTTVSFASSLHSKNRYVRPEFIETRGVGTGSKTLHLCSGAVGKCRHNSRIEAW